MSTLTLEPRDAGGLEIEDVAVASRPTSRRSCTGRRLREHLHANGVQHLAVLSVDHLTDNAFPFPTNCRKNGNQTGHGKRRRTGLAAVRPFSTGSSTGERGTWT
ncbi:hypothetical protein GCM10011581_26440 [Saccharopolyspora subtropica]|uniref:Uncharacterized protein n=1 Tax=Saccharopolyspora thermophila TaxID=89367 RepID=A0A917JVA4_9PSEU|nr:hypothetical protein [Saccharopolyspora subtropica]GGI88021.1 hypothetical protein GCM10011581_26440 [Saccharopolyspora subtropica]